MYPIKIMSKKILKILSFQKNAISLQSNSKEEVNIRGVAQLASASGLGPEGPVFESQYPDIETEADDSVSVSCLYLGNDARKDVIKGAQSATL